jgi:hypothetical protein
MGSGFRTFTAGEVLTASNVQNYLMDQSVMVFGGSAARSSAIGTANFEEGMVSYLTDTDKVEAYNGTDWVSVAPTTSQGLTLINTTSFSGVSSQSINDVFSTTYDNYVIQLNCSTGSVAAESISLRLRVSGADNSSNNYYYSLAFVPFSGTPTVSGSNGSGLTSSFVVSYINSTGGGASTIHLYDPFKTAVTRFQSFGGGNTSGDSIISRGGNSSVTTSYTGFTLIPATGTMTGTVSVYGYNK